jgi:PmbA protein
MSDIKSREERSVAILSEIIDKALKAGAEAADAVRFESVSESVSFRMGEPEDVERSESHDLGLRILVGKKQAFASSTDTRPEILDEMVERAVAMARNTPEDAFCGLAEAELLARDIPDLDLIDSVRPDADTLIRRASETEAAALAVDGVTNSEGADASWSEATIALATSTGFAHAYSLSGHSLSASVIAGNGTSMERDYDFDSTRHFDDLRSPADVGRKAGELAVRRFNPRKMKSTKAPVVFDPRVSGGLLGHMAGAISGNAVARQTSFLLDRLDKPVFAPGVKVIDDPHRRRGLNSKPFDAEGVAAKPLEIISDGRLTTWLLSSASARQLGLTTNGRAARSTTGAPSPSPSNLYMEPGSVSPEELIADIESGFYVTELIGFGVNGVTGDYSRGASGFWIENGEIAFPVSEMTIAGNLKDMFARLVPASDLAFRYRINAPTVRIDDMMVAGA